MWTVAAKTSDLQPGLPHAVQVNGLEIALFRVGPDIFALSALCPHKNGPLGMGFVDGKTVYCPLHGWGFDVTNGFCPEHPEKLVPSYPVRVMGDEIQVDLP
jgi:nitrite reductase/ring-hydroxylating ferredoxin subunit